MTGSVDFRPQGHDIGSLSFLPRTRSQRGRLDFALPTINIIFLLMLYFLVAGTLAQRNELNVAPPETSRYPADRLPRPLLLITDEGYVLDGLPIEPDMLVSAARGALDRARVGELNILTSATYRAEPFLALLAQFDAMAVPVRLVTVERSVSILGLSP